MPRIGILPRDAKGSNSSTSYINGIASGLCIGAIIIICLCLYLFRRRIFRLVHIGIPDEPEKKDKHLLTETELQSLPTTTGTSHGQDSCSICTEGLADGELRELPCGHEFHTHCVDPWLLKKSATCPLCRTLVSQPPEVDQAAMPSPPKRAFMRLLRREPSSTPRDVEAFPIVEANTRGSRVISAPILHKPMPTIAEVAFIAASASSGPPRNENGAAVR